MSQKNTKNSDSSEAEIVDIDYQIEKAEVGDTNASEKTKKEISDNLEHGTQKELIDELKGIYKQLEEKDELYENLHNRYLSTMADYENLEKRTKANRATILNQANKRLLLKLLDLSDSFERAEKSISSRESITVDSVIEGVNAVRKQFNTILKNEGIKKIEAIGEKFDPNFHEVVFVKPDSDSEEDTILEEVEVGYLLNSRLLRPTKVVVVKNKTKGEK